MSLSVWVTSHFMAFSVWITSCFHIAKNRCMGGGQEMPMIAVVKHNPPCMAFDDIVRVVLQTLVDNLQRTYETTSECSIEFEVDGPYKVGCFCSATFIRFISFFFCCLSVVRGTKPCRYHTLKYKPIRIFKKSLQNICILIGWV